MIVGSKEAAAACQVQKLQLQWEQVLVLLLEWVPVGIAAAVIDRKR
jgi:hypothetical protein